jgi:hypothetical protein
LHLPLNGSVAVVLRDDCNYQEEQEHDDRALLRHRELERGEETLHA